MDEIYSDVNNPAGLASIDKLYKEIKKVDKKITKEEVKYISFGTRFLHSV